MVGDIIYLRVLGQDIIILNSEEVANALLDKRSRKYSDRPVSAIAELYVVLPLRSIYTDELYTKKVRLGLGVLYLTLRAEVQALPAIVAPSLQCPCGADLPSKATAECVRDVNSALG